MPAGVHTDTDTDTHTHIPAGVLGVELLLHALKRSKQHTSYVSIRQHTSAYVSIRHTCRRAGR